MLSSKNESKVEERFQARIELLTERLDTLADMRTLSALLANPARIDQRKRA